MSRRPSSVSVTSQSRRNGDVALTLNLDPIPPKTKKGRSHSRYASFSAKSGLQLPSDSLSLDPDELFARYTVAEVKQVQQRLRADADAKQEELRLMVGERYRDLLQASASIISIAQSSKRVMEALEEAKVTITVQDDQQLPRQPSKMEEKDTDLQTLQLLSAHMKLLLDAPEHIWRLIERKKYFSAAWLYLLARVVHHALVRDDDPDEETSWSSDGLNVLEQFPLVQRQWDAVSQFRLQITHKATMSLRECDASAEETCAILLTLYFLDSRPLSETLSVFLGQRVKALRAKLSWSTSPLEADFATGDSRENNGHRPEDTRLADSKHTRFRRAPVREVRQALLGALDVILQTVKTSRDIFKVDPTTQTSMVYAALEYIQSDSVDNSPTSSLHAELQLTTQKLLATLPSSAHFLLLPPNLRYYKPYVDLTSPSSSVSQSQLSEDLHSWFRKATKSLRASGQQWLLNLQSAAEVWNVRSSILKWLKSASGLGEPEHVLIKTMFDDLCRGRLLEIWKATLADAENEFSAKLKATVSALETGNQVRLVDKSPVEYLFQVPPLPMPSSHAGLMFVDSPFRKYKSALRRQLMGRTLLLDQVLNALENCARTLQEDFARVSSEEGGENQMLTEQFTGEYQRDAKALCLGVIGVLETAADVSVDDISTVDGLIFVGEVAHELSSSSLFVTNVNCGEIAEQHFRSESRALRDQVMGHWRQHTVSKLVREYRSPAALFASYALPPSISRDISSRLAHALLSLSSAIQQLGLHQDPSRQRDIAEETLRSFIIEMVDSGVQLAQDLSFLHQLTSLWGTSWNDVCDSLVKRSKQMQLDIEEEATEPMKFFCRAQILLSTLLPPPPITCGAIETVDKSSTLLLYGSPDTEQSFQMGVRVAKPSSRFGLILVD